MWVNTKGKKYDTERWATLVRKCPKCYWGRVEDNCNVAGPKQKWHSGLDVSGGEGKILCYKQQHCIRTWNDRSMNQGKLDLVKQEMARVNINTVGISELKWAGMGDFNSDIHYVHYCGQESHRRIGVALTTLSNRVQNAILWYNLKNDRMILAHFEGKPFNITVIQA